MRSETMVITPELAGRWLTANKHNRPVLRATVRRYAEDMKAGRWELNAQGISFKENGELADGQHRLLAIIEADRPVTMMVTFGVPDTSFIYDRGRGRSQTNVLQMLGADPGVANNSVVGAINYLFYKCGNRPSDFTIVKFANDHAENLAAANNLVNRGKKNAMSRRSPVIAAAFIALECGVPQDTLTAFFTAVNTGFTNSRTESAAIVLRNWLLNWTASAHYAERDRAFMITNNAIADYAAKKPRVKLYKDNANPYFDHWKNRVMPQYLGGAK